MFLAFLISTIQNYYFSKGISMRFFSSLAIVFGFVASAAQAAPITLTWVSTSVVSSTITWAEPPPGPGPLITYSASVSSANIAGSITLPDASILSNSMINYTSTPGGQGLSASGYMSGFPVPATFPTNLALNPGSVLIASTTSTACQVISCQIAASLMEDAANAGRYYGNVLVLTRDLTGNLDRIEINTTISGTGVASYFVDQVPLQFGGNRILNAGVAGYWKVAGTTSVPLPNAAALLLAGLLGLTFFRRKHL
jgi:hypothetical protein